MSDEIKLTGYAEDSEVKRFIQTMMLPKVFHDIPINILNTGAFSIINEYMSQTMENLAFTSSFYFNEAFITKSVLPSSIYAEAAIFNIGYDFAIPSSCNFLLELKIEDILNNATRNDENGMMEFILDRDTQFNLSNGNIYSLDYDILIRYKDIKTVNGSERAWDIHYIKDNDQNSIAINKNSYIMHRVTNIWLCLMVNASEIKREVHTVVNTSANGMPNVDTVISTTGHICGFDIKYIDKESKQTGVAKFIAPDHILPINATVKDKDPYVHYIMDNSQTIRFMWQLNGTRYFTPEVNSSFEITVYTSHGAAANFTAFDNNDQPYVITNTKRYANNGNVMKAGFVISGSFGGTDIGNAETVRRMTVEAYNTANQIASDHDLDEYFKTFHFKNALFPFFFKRRDDPWGRIWSGTVALKDDDDYVFRTNTLHGRIPYNVLYDNSGNHLDANEVIIPPGWVWKYSIDETDDGIHTVEPFCQRGSHKIELANTFNDNSDDFYFVNPFGIKIQKQPFAIGYFNPWINETVTANAINVWKDESKHMNDLANVYHAYPIMTNIQRTYQDNYYKITSYIVPTISHMQTGEMASFLKSYISPPTFSDYVWRYFRKPLDEYAGVIPFIKLTEDDRYLPFDPDKTFICIGTKNHTVDGTQCIFDNIHIIDGSNIFDEDPDMLEANIFEFGPERVRRYTINTDHRNDITLTGNISLWDSNRCKPHVSTGDWRVSIMYDNTDKPDNVVDKEIIQFDKVDSELYYTFKVASGASGRISKIVVSDAAKSQVKTFGENQIYEVGTLMDANSSRTIDIYFDNNSWKTILTVSNAAHVYIPYDVEPVEIADGYMEFDFSNATAESVVMYATIKHHEEGNIDLYYVKMSDILPNEPVFYVNNKSLDYERNNMRVILHAFVNGIESGRTEMVPTIKESDGSYRYEAAAHPLMQLVDIDNRIQIASTRVGGGSWTPMTESNVIVDASNPEFRITILMKSSDKDVECELGDEYKGFIIVDEYQLEQASLIQELKEMRSVVDFSVDVTPTNEEIEMYNTLQNMMKVSYEEDNLYDVIQYIDKASTGTIPSSIDKFKTLVDEIAPVVKSNVDKIIEIFDENNRFKNDESRKPINDILDTLAWLDEWDGINHIPTRSVDSVEKVISYKDNNNIITLFEPDQSVKATLVSGKYYIDQLDDVYIKGENNSPFKIELVIWDELLSKLNNYGKAIEDLFQYVKIHAGMTVQLMPFVNVPLMNSTRFTSFVSSFTQIHKAMEPVINHRLDSNNFLDCKLIATYGKPRSYTTEYHKEKNDNVYWPDLSISMEFDISVKNQALLTDTLNKLRGIVKSYFAKITNVHTAAERLDKDNNIYISELLRLMLNENSDNIIFLKFVGWYTEDRKDPKSDKFMDANVQSIVQKWQHIDDFPTKKLESFIPEMFTLEDENIIFNII